MTQLQSLSTCAAQPEFLLGNVTPIAVLWIFSPRPSDWEARARRGAACGLQAPCALGGGGAEGVKAGRRRESPSLHLAQYRSRGQGFTCPAEQGQSGRLFPGWSPWRQEHAWGGQRGKFLPAGRVGRGCQSCWGRAPRRPLEVSREAVLGVWGWGERGPGHQVTPCPASSCSLPALSSQILILWFFLNVILFNPHSSLSHRGLAIPVPPQAFPEHSHSFFHSFKNTRNLGASTMDLSRHTPFQTQP